MNRKKNISRIKSTLLSGVAAAAACLFASPASATVTPQGWWHFGEVTDYYFDSSGLGHRFGQAFSCVGSGQAGAVVAPFGAGGPLGPTGFTSTSSLRWGANNCNAAGMWAPGFNPPATNYGVEMWLLPNANGVLGGNSTWIFGSGSSGGVSFRLTYNPDDNTSSIAAVIIGSNKQIGDSIPADPTRWIHLAIVNVDGTSTFYVDGVPNGAADVGNSTVPAGDIFAGSSPGTTPTFDGWLDELRIFTFNPGQFSTSDLLLRAPGPNILSQPQPEVVWDGGAAPFEVTAVIDGSLTYQWQSTSPIANATASEYYLPVVHPADSSSFSVVLSNAQGSLTSSNATLTVVPVQTQNVNFYHAAVQAESSLLAYFPVDGSTGAVLTNIVDPLFNAQLEGDAEYDGRTNRSFGERALRLKGSGDATIPNNPAYEFPSGNGTIEAIVYLDRALTADNETIFSMATAPDSAYYRILASADGSSLIYQNDSLAQPVTWAVPVSLLGRLAHVAVVFSNGNVTAYVDGLSLGTKPNATFGAGSGSPGYIGSTGLSSPGTWTGTIDELAIYGDALSANTIAIHNSRFLYGTAVTAPSIVTQPLGVKTLLAGGSPTFSVTASGTAPLSYQWNFKGSPIAGANSSTLSLSKTTVDSSGNYSVTVSNPIGTAPTQDFTVNFVAPSDAYAKAIMTDDPSAYWRLDETSGTTAFDLAGGHDGTYSGSVSQGAAGPFPAIADTAASFVGLGDGKVAIPYSPTLNPSTPFSVEYWINPKTHTPSGATYVPMGSQFRNGAGRLGWAFYMENDGPGWEVQMGDAGGVHADAYSTTDADVPGRYDHIVAVYDGVSTVQLFVNGNLESTASGNYVPNGTQPWIIGQRADGNFGFDGSIDEVAFYNYALTPDQITKHFSFAYIPAAVTTQPVDVSNGVEAGSITLTAAANGYPDTYQWYKGNDPIDPSVTNPDGTPHYQGATSSTLVITEATPADSGKYHLVVINPLGNIPTADANVTVALDTSAPTVSYVTAGATNRVRVAFSRAMDAAAAAVPANYSISGGVTVTGAVLPATTLGSDPTIVDLVTSPLTPGQQYTLSVSNLKDTRASQNPIGQNSTSFTAYTLTQGVVIWDFYANIPNTSVDSLISDPQYPDAVYTNIVLTNFSTSAITGGDLAGNPAFGSLGNNYGSHIYGWLTPTDSGSYRFFIRSDDSSQLNLSTDADPANAVSIANEPGCCNAFQEFDPNIPHSQTSDPIALVAGQSYYIEAFQKEGGGGDFVDVAWRKEGDQTTAANLQPIPGTFLSAYAPAPTVALEFSQPTVSGGQISIKWTGTGTLQESTDLKAWSNVAGNPGSGYNVSVSAAPFKFYRLTH